MNGKKVNFDPIAFGGDGGGVPHVPIPNTTVKPSSADGTWTAGSWESRTPPSKEPLPMMFGGGFYFVHLCEIAKNNSFQGIKR